MEWLERMRHALDRMERMMEEPFDMAEIAHAARTSPYHFQRMFHMLTGMTVAEYMRKRKLTLAAQELAMGAAKVLDVSLKYGYESPESFAKAFRKAHGIAPSEAKAQGASLKAYPRISFHLSLKGDKEMDYRIVKKDSFKVVGKMIRVGTENGENTRRIPAYWGECEADGTLSRLAEIGSGHPLLGICSMPPGEELLTYLVAVECDAEAEVPEDCVSWTVPQATWAVFTSVGPVTPSIQRLWGRIYSEWFPSCGYEHAPAPELEVYLEGDTNAEDYRCEVWIPVVASQA